MNKFFSVCLSVMILTMSMVARADVITNDTYFTVRQKLREMAPNDFKARKICERIEGERVHFTSRVISVRKSGSISADMDGSEIFSIPDINLSLFDTDEAENVRIGQEIEYTGVVTSCRYNTGFGSLFFEVGGGRLIKHY